MVFDLLLAVYPSKALRQLLRTTAPVLAQWRALYGPIRFYSGHSLGGWAASACDPHNAQVIRVTLNCAFPSEPGIKRVLFVRTTFDPVSSGLFRTGNVVVCHAHQT
jgi:hypothetical protein